MYRREKRRRDVSTPPLSRSLPLVISIPDALARPDLFGHRDGK